MQDYESANFKIMHLTPDRLRNLVPVTALDVYENNSDNFHESGLFSVSIFGRVGDPIRDKRFSYIHTKIKVMHPLIFRNVIKLKQFYGDIIKGTAYAVFDRNINDFVPADALDGDTGYNFFLSHWDDLVFEKNNSKQRNARIDFLEKYRKVALTENILVLPAGLRDIEVDTDGRDKEGEINEFYRRILSISNTISNTTNVNTRVTDSARIGIQNAFNAIYTYIMGLMRGKGGFILRKWAARKVFNATRTVISAMIPTTNILSDEDYPGWNHITIGIAQFLKAALPVGVHKLLNNDLVIDSFPGGDNNAFLINKQTLIRENVKVSTKEADKWTTQAGAEGLFQTFMEHTFRPKVIEIADHYIGLIYRGPNKTFKLLSDINDLEKYPWMDKKYIHPITYVELFYLMGYLEWNKYPIVSSRYPISGAGSCITGWCFVRTTVESEKRFECDDDGNPIKENAAFSFPILKNAIFIDSESISPSRLAGLGADFDGDMMGGIVIYSDESIEENKKYLNSASAYLDPGRGLINSPYTEPVERVIYNMTGD